MSYVSYSYTDGAARITLSAPERGNLIDAAMVVEFAAAVRSARADDARVVVLSALGKHFCVGGDMRAFVAAPSPSGYLDDLAESLHRVIADLQALDAICVSVVSGMAAGAGMPLAAAADIILAGEGAKFTLGYTKIGLSPDGGSTLLAASVGLHRALRLALLNPFVTAAEAQAMGLVAEVFPDEQLAERSEEVVATMLAASRTANVAAKRLLREQATADAVADRRRETESIRRAIDSPDGREGIAAFLAKRPPVFNA